MTAVPPFDFLDVTLCDGVATAAFARPEKANAFHRPMWHALGAAMHWADETPGVRVVVLHGAGAHFSAGIDLAMLGELRGHLRPDTPGRGNEALRRLIVDLQENVSAIETCRKPVIAAVHGFCIGGGLDIAAACDFRYASADAQFSLKEVDMGIVADLGSLQRLPRIVGEGVTRELAYSARMVDAQEALSLRLVNRVFASREALLDGARDMARTIATKSPLAVRGSKEAISYARDRSVADGLAQVAAWNTAMLVSEDLAEALAAFQGKRPGQFLD
jgi:enoyl-CoA hydratase/carnithine racemase